MTIQAGRIEALVEQINGGAAAAALPEVDLLLAHMPENPGLLSLRAEALRLAGHPVDAIAAYRRAAERGAGARSWLAAGILLAAERATDQAVECLLQALAATPNDEQVLDALVTTFFNGNRHREGIEFARRQLAQCSEPSLLSHAALLLHACDLHQESSDAFKRIIPLAPDDPAVVGAAIASARFTCEWDWIESLQRRLSAWYDRDEFAAPQEFPLTHVTWCPDEARNAEVTRAYVERMVPRVHPISGTGTSHATGGRIRIGYASCDFRNHATMHLMAGLLEHHDRERFEIFAYDYSSPDISEYRQRFLNSVEHHVPIHSMSDRQAAARIADDRLDVLLDLKLYTGAGRSGIMAYRPAPLQVAYLGFPGSAACPDIDYTIADRFVTPDSSAPHYLEKLCRLPHTYQCNDRQRVSAPAPSDRSAYGLPDDDRIVFGAFNQSYKIDRGSFSVWMRILQAVPDSVLWLLGQTGAAVTNLSLQAQLSGIDPGRLIFAPFAVPHEHLARLQLADAMLDTLICNGHTTTSDALWAGVPVITARGRHFASRVSESLLNAMELPELVGSDDSEMVRIATRLGMDRPYRIGLREKLAANRLSAPLFDTARFTRNFEAGIELMVRRHRGGLAPEHIEVPDSGAIASPGRPALSSGRVSILQTSYPHCPLCAGPSTTLGFANCTAHSLWHEPLQPSIEWMRCQTCAHIHSRGHWTQTGLAELLRNAQEPTAISAEQLATARLGWAPTLERVLRLMGGYRAALRGAIRPIWVDIGCGDGTLTMTASDYGFAAVGIDIRADAVAHLQALGCNAMHQNFMQLSFEIEPQVLSMMDVLAHLPDPREALQKAAQVLRPGGVLALSTTDCVSSSWRAMEATNTNPHWVDLERHHVFTREHILALLSESGFEPANVSIAGRRARELEICAVRN